MDLICQRFEFVQLLTPTERIADQLFRTLTASALRVLSHCAS